MTPAATTHIVSTLQEEVEVSVQEALVGVVVATKVLEELVSQVHYLTHTVVISLEGGEKGLKCKRHVIPKGLKYKLSMNERQSKNFTLYHTHTHTYTHTLL